MVRVLIVEDELIIAQDIKEILEEEHYVCIAIVRTLEDAIEHIELHTPDLVLIDVMLNHKKDGIAIGKHLFEKQTIPYIFITSSCDKNSLSEIKQTYPSGFIVKPFKPSDILTTIEIAMHNFYHDLEAKKTQVTLYHDYDAETPYQIKKVLEYIHNNIADKMLVDNVAKLTRWKTNHFTSIFKKYMKLTPYQYVLKVKIDKCIIAMKTENRSVSEIAFELGFNSYSSFSKMFKKTTGFTVEEYKKQHIVTSKKNYEEGEKQLF